MSQAAGSSAGMDGVFSVAEVIRYLGDVLAEDVILGGLWVQGEVSNLTHSAAGHCYFSLKDEESQLKTVAFRNSGVLKGVLRSLKNGDQVLAHGRLGVYEAQGSVQLYLDHVQPSGLGLLRQRFDELCQRLREEGLFAEERKRPLPLVPRCIGVVTSAQAAAFQDICRVLGQRFPAVEVLLAPTLVQGVSAPEHIIASLDHLATLDCVDVIIVARGGGSVEDLWAFNDEGVARAIARAVVPVVTGVGHETDFTIADFVADLRAPTPSAAAMAVVPDQVALREQIEANRAEIQRGIVDHLSIRRGQVGEARRGLAQHTPRRQVAQMRQQVDDGVAVIADQLAHVLALQRERLRARTAELALLHPLLALERGYALVTDGFGRPVTRAAAMDSGDAIHVRLRDGTLAATVDEVRRLSQSRPHQ